MVFLIFSCEPFIYKHNTKIYEGDVAIDDKAHPKNSLEWWYLTGFLEGDNGKIYGVEYVIFHFRALTHQQYYMVNVAISDPEDSTFIFDHEIKLSKKAIDESMPMKFSSHRYLFQGAKGQYQLNANMKKRNAGFNLKTTPTQPPVYHQDSGYVQCGDIAAAGYYSYPKLKTEGNIYIEEDTINVTGTLWYDRQWNAGDMYSKHISWDWSAINLSDSTELMIYRVTDKKNNHIELGGTYISKDLSTMTIAPEDITFEPITYWTSPKSKKTYPIKWSIDIPKINLNAELTATYPDQELKIKKWLTIYYWEGMCQLIGTKDNQKITGEAYLEMNNR